MSRIKSEKQLVRSESAEQKDFVLRCRAHKARYRGIHLIYKIPNEGKRSPQTAVTMKNEGMEPGMPDLCLPVACGGYHALYIEMKRRGEKNDNPIQLDKQDELQNQGNAVTCCWSAEEAWGEVMRYYQGLPIKTRIFE